MNQLRVAFCGASGTGKTTLASFIAEEWGLPINPVGSRSVAKTMGFDSPYDVDKAGKRADFQRRLATEKVAWEAGHESFVSDRTTLDNLAYTVLHDVRSIDAELVEVITAGLQRYTHIIYCPVDVFCNPGDDAARVKDLTYHKLFDAALVGLLMRNRPSQSTFVTTLSVEGLEARKETVRIVLGSD